MVIILLNFNLLYTRIIYQEIKKYVPLMLNFCPALQNVFICNCQELISPDVVAVATSL